MRWQLYLPRLLLLSLTILVVGGCAASYEPRPLAEVNFLDRAQTQTQGNIWVTAAVLSAGETEQVFGFPLYKKGIQPVWLQVENKEEAMKEQTSQIQTQLPIEVATYLLNEKKYDFEALVNTTINQSQLERELQEYLRKNYRL